MVVTTHLVLTWQRSVLDNFTPYLVEDEDTLLKGFASEEPLSPQRYRYKDVFVRDCVFLTKEVV